jgi:hypothetical protein
MVWKQVMEDDNEVLILYRRSLRDQETGRLRLRENSVDIWLV